MNSLHDIVTAAVYINVKWDAILAAVEQTHTLELECVLCFYQCQQYAVY